MMSPWRFVTLCDEKSAPLVVLEECPIRLHYRILIGIILWSGDLARDHDEDGSLSPSDSFGGCRGRRIGYPQGPNDLLDNARDSANASTAANTTRAYAADGALI